MTQTTHTKPTIDKDALKAAVTEALHEDRGLLHDAVMEAMEDIALAKAIREGLESGRASRADVLRSLEGEA